MPKTDKFRQYLNMKGQMMSECFLKTAKSSHLIFSFSFHYSAGRLEFLSESLRSLNSFNVSSLKVFVFTNAQDADQLSKIESIFLSLGLKGEVCSECNLKHPFDLTWAHKRLIKNWVCDTESQCSHFIYLEDDERFTFDNFLYFLEARQELKAFGLIPGYVRTEWKTQTAEFTSTDIIAPISLSGRKAVVVNHKIYINLDNPYSGMFVLDRQLASEYVQTRSFDKAQSVMVSQWKTRERAAAGLIFEAIPTGFFARTVVPVRVQENIVDPRCWIAHLPNNYANDTHSPFGSVPMHKIFEERIENLISSKSVG